MSQLDRATRKRLLDRIARRVAGRARRDDVSADKLDAQQFDRLKKDGRFAKH